MSEETRCRHEIMTNIIDLAKELGVRFAFPTSTIHIEDFPEKQSLTPKYTDNKDGFLKKMTHFFDKKKGN
jgi:MscS family membrane protein